MKRILNIITKKAFISLFIFLVEILILIIFGIALEKNFMTFWLINYILNIITAFSIVNSNLSNAFKLTWVIGLILLPGIGTVLFFVFGRKPTTKKMKRVFQQTKINQNSILNFKSKFEQSSINPAYLQIMSWIWNISSSRCPTMRWPMSSSVSSHSAGRKKWRPNRLKPTRCIRNTWPTRCSSPRSRLRPRKRQSWLRRKRPPIFATSILARRVSFTKSVRPL